MVGFGPQQNVSVRIKNIPINPILKRLRALFANGPYKKVVASIYFNGMVIPPFSEICLDSPLVKAFLIGQFEGNADLFS